MIMKIEEGRFVLSRFKDKFVQVSESAYNNGYGTDTQHVSACSYCTQPVRRYPILTMSKFSALLL